MRSIPEPFEIYRHFKGNLYQIIAIARDSESDRKVVVYQALYGDYSIYVRDLDNFCSLTDKDKYPGAGQKYRFEKVETGCLADEAVTDDKNDIADPLQKNDTDNAESKAYHNERSGDSGDPIMGEGGVDPAVIEFLDADTYEQKLNILASVKHRITDEMLAAMSIGADIELSEGSVEDKYSSLKNCLLTKDKFERVRLR